MLYNNKKKSNKRQENQENDENYLQESGEIKLSVYL